MIKLLAIFAFSLFLSACWESYTYRAEVGYFEGAEQRWFVGSDKSRDDCQTEAINRYNALNRESPGRAFSWACRQMSGDQFITRVR